MNSKSDLQPSPDIQTLLAIMKHLRSPDGCPWDREQTKESLVAYTLEEAYEVADAVNSGKGYKICEELGDLLLQIVFLSQIAEEQGLFSFGDVVTAITSKLIRRHPHVFSDACAATPSDVSKLWAEVKAKEADSHEVKVPPLPGLVLLEKLVGKVDPETVADPLLRQVLMLAERAKGENRSLEAVIRGFYANFWSQGEEFQE